MFDAPMPAEPGRELPLLEQLNPEQRAAVTLPATHALILAGAGSGKTRVLTSRIAWLMQTGQVGPGGVLAVTFTNKAAKEMLTRLAALLPVNVRGMWIGTFHGLCNRLLRAHWKLANLPQAFQILDTQDQLSAVKRVCKQFGVDEERYPPKQLQYFISGCKEDGLRPRDVQARGPDIQKKIEIYQLYEDQCQREGVVDFGELMLRSFELLRDNGPLREHYQRRFRHVLIDEFQDTNRLQYAWIKQLTGHTDEAGHFTPGDNAVMAVGDDDQSIYAFRGARVGNMADFLREYGVAAPIKLEENYRSHSHILDAANELIGHNEQRLGKNLRTAQPPGEPVRAYEAASDFAEAQWVLDEIRQLASGDGLARAQIAILYRSNAQSRVVETALFNAGIPYRVYGGLRFFERAEIKHALAYLRLLDNPRDDTSFLRVVNFPPRGIGARTVEQLQDAARAQGSALADAAALLPGAARGKVESFIALMTVLRERTAGKTLREIVERVLDDSGLLEHYRAERDGADRLENLEELASAAEAFVTQEGFGRDSVALPLDETGAALTQSPVSQGLDPDAPLLDEEPTGETLSPLAAFLTHAALEAGDNQAQAGQDAVQLMTVHAAKGLEFDAVFITGLEEGLFPHENAQSDRASLEEERRLMYVAITRARQRLYLTHAQTRLLHGQTRYSVPSRFFDELPAPSLKARGTHMPTAHGQGQTWFDRYTLPKPAWGASARASSAPEPAYASAAGTAATALRPGQKVFHNKFGEGTVRAVEGSGDDARAQVDFPRHGVKWLALAVAKLTVI